MKKLNTKLKSLREWAGLKQSDVADIAGITQAYLSELETGKKPLSKEAVEKIASALNKLDDDPKNKIDPETLWREHLISLIPEEIQKGIHELILKIDDDQHKLYELLENMRIDSDSNHHYKVHDQFIKYISRKHYR